MHVIINLLHVFVPAGEVIGFTDLGDINSHLLKFEQTFMDKKEDL